MHKRPHRTKGSKANPAVALLLSNLVGLGEHRRLFWRYAAIMLVPTVLIFLGTGGYMVIEKSSFLDALYMTVITLTTVGYGEIPHELSSGGRIFTMVLLLGGVFTLFWAAGEMIRTIVSGEVQGILERRRMERRIAELNGHFIVCGFG